MTREGKLMVEKERFEKMNKSYNVLDKGFVQYVDHMGSDQRIVEAARVSYNGHSKGSDKDKKLLMYLYRNSHSSPFEMCKITFKIKMPLFVAAQFNRHRMQCLNYVSHRYTQPDEDFYIPETWRKQSTDNKQVSDIIENDEWMPKMIIPIETVDGLGYKGHKSVSRGFETFCEIAFRTYQSMVDAGVGREMARMILPQNLYTMCYSTWDLNNLIKFLKLRDHEHAQWEIQQYAKAMRKIAELYFPWTFEAYEKYKK
jgi:thymidylate synthase (FAD)